MLEHDSTQSVKIVVSILNFGGVSARKRLKQAKFPFLKYCRFVVSDNLGMTGTS